MKRFALRNSALMVGLAFAIPSSYAQTAATLNPFLPNPVQFASTVPSNGDVNPYGVAVVPANFPSGGVLNPGDILVSNFNNNQNLQGTGTTIVQITGGKQNLFYQAASSDASLTNGPWGMAIDDRGAFTGIYVANALSGTVSRIEFWTLLGEPVITGNIQIGSGNAHRCDPAALVVAPGELSYDVTTDRLYVASADDNAVFSIPNASSRNSDAGTGNTVYSDPAHLHGALMLAQAPNGDLLVSNADVINSDPNQPSEIVEFSTAGQFIKEMSVHFNQGDSFGLYASPTS